MLDEQDALCDALRDALGPESQAPPSVTRLDDALRDVVAEGRRRVFGQRVAAAVGVVAVVGVVAFAATALGGRTGPGRVSSAAGPMLTTTSVPASTPAATPTTAPFALPGWQEVRMGPIEKDGFCVSPLPPVPDGSGGALPAKYTVEHTLISAVSSVRPDVKTDLAQSAWTENPAAGGPRGYVRITVTGTGGTGEVDIEVQRYLGSPVAAADKEAFVYGSCVRPQRRELATGAVLQLYPANPTVNQQRVQRLSRYVRVYEPTGREYIVGDLGWVAGGMPLTDEQLASVADQVATLG